MTDSPNVYQRMQTACSIIDGQAWVKDLSNSQYKSIPIDAMRAGVRKACVQAGLVHTGPDDLIIDRERSSDGRTVRFYATCKFHYINADNPTEVIEYESAGEAMDNGDKGTGKAITNLIKNHYKSAFDIGEQEDQSKDDVDSYSNGQYHRKVAEQEIVEKKAAQDKQQKIMLDKMTEWAFGDTMTDACMEIVLRYANENGVMDTWSRETVKACYDECLKAREGTERNPLPKEGA